MKNAAIIFLSVACVVLAACSLWLLDAAIRGGYSDDSLTKTQKEFRTISSLYAANLTPGYLVSAAQNANLPITEQDMQKALSSPKGAMSAYRCGDLTFFFDSNSRLIDIRGHLLEVSLFQK